MNYTYFDCVRHSKTIFVDIHKVYTCVPILPVTIGRVSIVHLLTELGHIEAGFELSSYQLYSSKVFITSRRQVTQLCSLDSQALEIKSALTYWWHSFGDPHLL